MVAKGVRRLNCESGFFRLAFCFVICICFTILWRRVPPAREGITADRDITAKIFLEKVKAHTLLRNHNAVAVRDFEQTGVMQHCKNSDKALCAYDLIEPDWSCELESRFGPQVFNPGDGPKFVCGARVLAAQKECIVYSIGSAFDFTFEYAVHKVAPHCKIHTFDGTINITHDEFGRVLPIDLEEKNIFFHNWNIEPDCSSNEVKFHGLCISDTLKTLGHSGKRISWFKIDCEGCEYTVIPRLLQAGEVLIDQVLIEVHGTDAKSITSLFKELWRAGFLLFHKERNQWGCLGYQCVEFSLMSKDYARQVLWHYIRVNQVTPTGDH